MSSTSRTRTLMFKYLLLVVWVVVGVAHGATFTVQQASVSRSLLIVNFTNISPLSQVDNNGIRLTCGGKPPLTWIRTQLNAYSLVYNLTWCNVLPRYLSIDAGAVNSSGGESVIALQFKLNTTSLIGLYYFNESQDTSLTIDQHNQQTTRIKNHADNPLLGDLIRDTNYTSWSNKSVGLDFVVPVGLSSTYSRLHSERGLNNNSYFYTPGTYMEVWFRRSTAPNPGYTDLPLASESLLIMTYNLVQSSGTYAPGTDFSLTNINYMLSTNIFDGPFWNCSAAGCISTWDPTNTPASWNQVGNYRNSADYFPNIRIPYWRFNTYYNAEGTWSSNSVNGFISTNLILAPNNFLSQGMGRIYNNNQAYFIPFSDSTYHSTCDDIACYESDSVTLDNSHLLTNTSGIYNNTILEIGPMLPCLFKMTQMCGFAGTILKVAIGLDYPPLTEVKQNGYDAIYNSIPVVTSDVARTTTYEDVPVALTIPVQIYDNDVNSMAQYQPLVILAATLPTRGGFYYQGQLLTNIPLSINSSMMFVPDPRTYGINYTTVNITVSDGLSTSRPIQWVFDVLHVNHVPNVTNLTATATLGISVRLNFTVGDYDPGDFVATVAIKSLPIYGVLRKLDGTLINTVPTLVSGSLLDYRPFLGSPYNVNDTFLFNISDSAQGWALVTSRYTITLINYNSQNSPYVRQKAMPLSCSYAMIPHTVTSLSSCKTTNKFVVTIRFNDTITSLNSFSNSQFLNGFASWFRFQQVGSSQLIIPDYNTYFIRQTDFGEFAYYVDNNTNLIIDSALLESDTWNISYTPPPFYTSNTLSVGDAIVGPFSCIVTNNYTALLSAVPALSTALALYNKPVKPCNGSATFSSVGLVGLTGDVASTMIPYNPNVGGYSDAWYANGNTEVNGQVDCPTSISTGMCDAQGNVAVIGRLINAYAIQMSADAVSGYFEGYLNNIMGCMFTSQCQSRVSRGIGAQYTSLVNLRDPTDFVYPVRSLMYYINRTGDPFQTGASISPFTGVIENATLGSTPNFKLAIIGLTNVDMGFYNISTDEIGDPIGDFDGTMLTWMAMYFVSATKYICSSPPQLCLTVYPFTINKVSFANNVFRVVVTTNPLAPQVVVDIGSSSNTPVLVTGSSSFTLYETLVTYIYFESNPSTMPGSLRLANTITSTILNTTTIVVYQANLTNYRTLLVFYDYSSSDFVFNPSVNTSLFQLYCTSAYANLVYSNTSLSVLNFTVTNCVDWTNVSLVVLPSSFHTYTRLFSQTQSTTISSVLRGQVSVTQAVLIGDSRLLVYTTDLVTGVEFGTYWTLLWNCTSVDWTTQFLAAMFVPQGLLFNVTGCGPYGDKSNITLNVEPGGFHSDIAGNIRQGGLKVSTDIVWQGNDCIYYNTTLSVITIKISGNWSYGSLLYTTCNITEVNNVTNTTLELLVLGSVPFNCTNTFSLIDTFYYNYTTTLTVPVGTCPLYIPPRQMSTFEKLMVFGTVTLGVLLMIHFGWIVWSIQKDRAPYPLLLKQTKLD